MSVACLIVTSATDEHAAGGWGQGGLKGSRGEPFGIWGQGVPGRAAVARGPWVVGPGAGGQEARVMEVGVEAVRRGSGSDQRGRLCGTRLVLLVWLRSELVGGFEQKSDRI